MKVVFLESIEGTALVGEVKEVKNGFARNYLLPRGLAAPAIEPFLTRAEAGAKREAKKQEALDQDAQSVADKLEGSRITMIAKVGEQGKLYGSITSVHIAEEVTKLLEGDAFDHRKVLLPEAIKEVGVQPVRLRLTRNVEAAIEVEVIAESVDEEDEPIPLDGEAVVDDAGDATPAAGEEAADVAATAELADEATTEGDSSAEEKPEATAEEAPEEDEAEEDLKQEDKEAS
ncbi:MAG: 50S ribosomal protein L9 [Chloroflexi bacterium]|nr:50S ribosomal protein L9 [Chloroflexota bacterium]